jgi:hypothetical protein
MPPSGTGNYIDLIGYSSGRIPNGNFEIFGFSDLLPLCFTKPYKMGPKLANGPLVPGKGFMLATHLVMQGQFPLYIIHQPPIYPLNTMFSMMNSSKQPLVTLIVMKII